MPSTRVKPWFVLLTVIAAACNSGNSELMSPTGGFGAPGAQTGQSGTDGSSSTGCPFSGEVQVSFDEVTSRGTAAALRQDFERILGMRQAVPLRWTPRFGGTTTVDIRVARWGTQAVVRMYGPPCANETLLAPVTLTIKTADGAIDEEIEGHINGGQFFGAGTGSGATPSAFLSGLPQRLEAPSLRLDSYGLVLHYSADQWGNGDFAGTLSANAAATEELNFALSQALFELATFDRHWPANTAIGVPFRRSPHFDALCAGGPFEPGPTPSASAGITPLVGRWVLCEGMTTGVVAHAGIEIMADGRWKHLQEQNGQLSELLGFDHEGKATALDGRSVFGLSHSEYALSKDKKRLRLGHQVSESHGDYLIYAAANKLSVTPAQPQHMTGERAGSAACATSPAYLQDVGSAAELRKQLVGSWHFCQGALLPDADRITFKQDGGYLVQAADGRTVAQGRYEVIDDASAGTHFNLMDDNPANNGGWYVFNHPVISRAPLMLRANARSDGPTVMSALP